MFPPYHCKVKRFVFARASRHAESLYAAGMGSYIAPSCQLKVRMESAIHGKDYDKYGS
jgi:hypothetical protein